MSNHLQVKDAITSYRHSTRSGGSLNYPDTPQKDVSSPKTTHTSPESLQPESVNQSSPSEVPIQNTEYDPQPSTLQSSLPAVYPVQYYSIYPQNFLMTPSFQPAMNTVCLFARSCLECVF